MTLRIVLLDYVLVALELTLSIVLSMFTDHPVPADPADCPHGVVLIGNDGQVGCYLS